MKLLQLHLACLGTLLAASGAQAASVRGQLLCQGKTPARGIAVTVNSGKVRSAPSFTGTNGMFYLNGLPAGVYTLEVWLSRQGSTPALTQQLSVTEPVTDVEPLNLQVCSAT